MNSKIPRYGVNNPKFRSRIFGFDESAEQVRRYCVLAETYLREAIHNRPTGSKWMVIFGPCGVGKSVIGRAVESTFNMYAVDMWKEQIWKGGRIPHAEFLDWPIISVAPEETWQDKLFHLRETDLAVIDDLGAEVDRFKSGEPTERVRQMLNLFKDRWLYVTTNVKAEQWEERYDVRIQSRLSQGRYINLNGVKDWRKKP